MTDRIKCPKCGKIGGVLKDASGYICHSPTTGIMVCGHTFKKMSEPTEKDYQDYLRGLIRANENEIKELEESLEHVLARLQPLEEKERERARDEHAKEEHFDFLDSEGLGKQ